MLPLHDIIHKNDLSNNQDVRELRLRVKVTWDSRRQIPAAASLVVDGVVAVSAQPSVTDEEDEEQPPCPGSSTSFLYHISFAGANTSAGDVFPAQLLGCIVSVARPAAALGVSPAPTSPVLPEPPKIAWGVSSPSPEGTFGFPGRD